MAEPFKGKVWRRFDHWVREIRPLVYRTEQPGGQVIGYITVKGSRYQARSSYGGSVATSEPLGVFESGAAALWLVIGHHAMEALRAQVKKEVIELERAEGTKSPRAARGRYPGAV